MATMYGGHPGAIPSPGHASGASRGATDRTLHRQSSSLDTLIQREIIPRLLGSHPPPVTLVIDGPEPARMTAEEVQAFAPLPISLEADELLARVDEFLARGVAVESIFIDLLAPSARKLGQFWEDDTCDFVDVTMGLWRLQEVMREVAMRVPAVTQALCEPRTALFSPFPGEQHSFGALMVEEMFSRAGWASEALIEPQRQELLRVIGKRNFDLLGLTISNDCPSRALSDLITSARSVSKNPAIQIFIGGRVVNANPGLANEVGADGTAPDARSALALAERKVPGARLIDLAVL